MTNLKVTFDGLAPQTIDLKRFLSLRSWSPRERDRIELVETGMIRRMSTDLDGRPCDIELAAS